MRGENKKRVLRNQRHCKQNNEHIEETIIHFIYKYRSFINARQTYPDLQYGIKVSGLSVRGGTMQ